MKMRNTDLLLCMKGSYINMYVCTCVSGRDLTLGSKSVRLMSISVEQGLKEIAKRFPFHFEMSFWSISTTRNHGFE